MVVFAYAESPGQVGWGLTLSATRAAWSMSLSRMLRLVDTTGVTIRSSHCKEAAWQQPGKVPTER